MKIQFRTSRFITGVTVVCALAIATTAFAKNPKAVSLEIIRIGSDDQLTITTKPGANDCDVSSRQDKGCIKFKKNEKESDIIFQLKGDTKCQLDSGTDWKLSAVYLGGFNSSSKPSKDDFGFDNTPDPDYEKVNSDFGIANRTSGLVTSVKGPDKKKITINDKNKSKFNVWYKIEAICEREDRKPAHTRTSDPRVKNGGTE